MKMKAALVTFALMADPTYAQTVTEVTPEKAGKAPVAWAQLTIGVPASGYSNSTVQVSSTINNSMTLDNCLRLAYTAALAATDTQSSIACHGADGTPTIFSCNLTRLNAHKPKAACARHDY